MDTKVKKAWVKALRSGDYEQGKHVLARRKPHGKTQHCCLGVLCDITPGIRRGKKEYANESKGVRITFNECDTYLPTEVAEPLGLSQEKQGILADLNDSGKSFAEIADYIEEKL